MHRKVGPDQEAVGGSPGHLFAPLVLEFGEAKGAHGPGLVLEAAGVRAGLCAVPDAARLLHAAGAGHEDRVQV